MHDTIKTMGAAERRVAVVTDSSCDLPPHVLEGLGVEVAPLTVRIDGQTFLDKRGITPEAFHNRLLSAKEAGTSPPPPEAFAELYERLLRRFDEVVSVHLCGMHSQTFHNARHGAAAHVHAISVVDARTHTVGLGLVVQAAARAACRGLGMGEVVEAAFRATQDTSLFFCLAGLDSIMKSGRLHRGLGALANFLGVKPVVGFDHATGEAYVAAKGFSMDTAHAKLLDLVAKRAEGLANPRFAVAHVAAPDAAEFYAIQLRRRFGMEPDFILPASSALAVHVGPGAAAIAITEA